MRDGGLHGGVAAGGRGQPTDEAERRRTHGRPGQRAAAADAERPATTPGRAGQVGQRRRRRPRPAARATPGAARRAVRPARSRGSRRPGRRRSSATAPVAGRWSAGSSARGPCPRCRAGPGRPPRAAGAVPGPTTRAATTSTWRRGPSGSGTRMQRTIVASTSTAVASPTPNIFTTALSGITKDVKTATMISAAAVISCPVSARPRRTAVTMLAGPLVVLVERGEQEHLVVHGQPEQDREHHHRHVGLDRAPVRPGR